MLMARITEGEKLLVWIVSAAIGVIIGLTALINALFLKVPLAFEMDELILIALMVAISPPAVVNLIDSRWRAAVDNAIPNFLRELSEAGRTGVTLTRAMEMASKRRYGPLSDEVNRIVTQISWGMSLDEALKRFSERVDTRLSTRTASIISEVSKAGGEIREILETVSLHIGELQTIERERVSMLRPYVAIVYVAFFIFLFVDIMLIRTFFVELAETKTMMAEAGGGGLLAGGVDLERVIRVMFHITLFEGFSGGMVAGKMGENMIGAGLKHSVILMVIGFVAFYLIVWRPIV